MSAAAVSWPCPVCDQPLPSEAPTSCPHCALSGEWIDALHAIDFTLRRFLQWSKEGILSNAQFRSIVPSYRQKRLDLVDAARQGGPLPESQRILSRQTCWCCQQPVNPLASHCAQCGAAAHGTAVRSIRFLGFLRREVQKQQAAGRLTLPQTHECLSWIQERWATLRNRLESNRAPVVEAVAASPPPADPWAVVPVGAPKAPARSLWDMLLDPRSIQWLLAFGGSLLVVGLVIWLATLGLLDRPGLVAAMLGVANVGVLLSGWAVIFGSRYQLAGRALTLLACLVMPLNLWFYHAHQLLTLDGHLWLAALVCCVFYAASALVLRDPLFVHVLMAGGMLTGLLILADLHRLTPPTNPAMLLVFLGLIAMHAEPAFPNSAGVFSRRRFGRAFFWSGQSVLAAGLLVLFAAQFVSWFYQPFFRHLGVAAPPLASNTALQLNALFLVLCGTYACLYAYIVVQRHAAYLFCTALMLLWLEVSVIDLFDLAATPEHIIIALSATALLVTLVHGLLNDTGTLGLAVPPLTILLNGLSLWIGLFLFWRATGLRSVWPYVPDAVFVGALLVTAVSCRLAAHVYQSQMPWAAVVNLCGCAGATLLAAAGLLVALGLEGWARQAPLLMLVPIAYLAAAAFYRGTALEQPVAWAAHTATGLMIVASLVSALEVAHTFGPGQNANLLLAGFCFLATVFYALAALIRKEEFSIYLGAAMAAGAVWQLLAYASVSDLVYAPIFAGIGLTLLFGYRLAVLETYEQHVGVSGAVFACGAALLSLGGVGGGLQVWFRLLLGRASWDILMMLAALVGASLLAVLLVNHRLWRRWLVLLTLGLTLLTTFTAFQLLSRLNAWQRLELLCVGLGVLLLIVSHLGWYREQERQSDAVTLGLILGSLLAGLPLAIAVLVHRSTPRFSIVDEIGLLVVGVMLLSTGFVFQVKATTLTGAGLVTLWLITLVMFIGALQQVQLAGLLLAIGGSGIFLVGLMLSVFRDRLRKLPDHIKRREGIFRVLGWR